MGDASRPSPVYVAYPGVSTGRFFVDGVFGISDSYIKSANRACLADNVQIGTAPGVNCDVFIQANLYKDPGEAGCRLVVYFYSDDVAFQAFYRSPVIADCCASLTLDLYTTNISVHCASQPATVTATPICPDEGGV